MIDASAIFEFPVADHAIADASGYPVYRRAGVFYIECPRAFGDRYEWPRRWDLEITKRMARSA